MRNWQSLAEEAARRRCAEIVDRLTAAVAAHAPDADVASDAEIVRARGRGLARRWLSEPGLRFAPRIKP